MILSEVRSVDGKYIARLILFLDSLRLMKTCCDGQLVQRNAIYVNPQNAGLKIGGMFTGVHKNGEAREAPIFCLERFARYLMLILTINSNTG